MSTIKVVLNLLVYILLLKAKNNLLANQNGQQQPQMSLNTENMYSQIQMNKILSRSSKYMAAWLLVTDGQLQGQ